MIAPKGAWQTCQTVAVTLLMAPRGSRVGLWVDSWTLHSKDGDAQQRQKLIRRSLESMPMSVETEDR